MQLKVDSRQSIQIWISLYIAGLLLAMGTGCNWFKPLAFILPEPKKRIPAEFAHLKESAAVLVWARPETLYDYPNARLEVASHVADQLKAHLSSVKFSDVFEVEDYLERNSTRLADPEQLGREFSTRYVIYLELLEFSCRVPQVPDLLQGNIRSSVVVYELADQTLPAKRYELAPVHTTVPKGQPLRFSQSRAILLRKTLYETFAGAVAKKFYDHQEIVE